MSDVTAITGPSPVVGDPDLPAGGAVGEFVIEGRLGKGAFGSVYKAAHPVIGKQVAIKVLSHRFSADEQVVERFIAEARAVNQIGHPNIIDIFSFGVLPDGRHYFVMEYLDGAPLDAALARGPMTVAEALPILRPIARALDAAHAKGIAHRDLKPENIFLGRDADGALVPKLLDFGIAKLLGPDDGLRHKTQTGAALGTPHYMSPEQCRGRDVDHRTDYYAFGVLAYRMLTGVLPIGGEDYLTILLNQISNDPEPPSRHVPALAHVDGIVLQLMAKDAAARPPDLATATRALEEPPPAPPPPVEVPAQLPPPRSRAPIVVAAIAALAAATVVVVLATREHAAPAPAPPSPIVVATPDAASADAATHVTITVVGAPPATEVLLAGELVGHVPAIVLPRSAAPVTLTFRAPDHAPAAVQVTPDVDKPVTIALVARAPAKATRPTVKRDTRDIARPNWRTP